MRENPDELVDHSARKLSDDKYLLCRLRRHFDDQAEAQKITFTLKILPDRMVIALYEYWSEETHRASFLAPSSDVVAQFKDWLGSHFEEGKTPQEDYEVEMLRLFRKASIIG